MNEPLISVVMCTYNGEKFLQQQIESLLAQTYSNFEVIIADDCSKDGTRQLLEQWRNKPTFTIIFNERNLGYSQNFQQVAARAKGDFIAFCDQDDIWMPQKLQRLYNSINGCSLVFSDSILIDEEGKELGKKLSDIRRLQSIWDTRTLAFMNIVSGHTMLVRREVMQKALPIPEKTYHDWWLAVVAAADKGVFYLNETLTYYRQHTSMVTTNIITKKDLKSRSLSKRFEDYARDLRWMELVMQASNEKDKPYLQHFISLFRERERGRFSWSLFLHLLKERKTVFKYSWKKPSSQYFELRKMARGERNELFTPTNPD